jgi:hypothetical protein
MKINGVEYETKDLDFTNVLCDLEDNDIDIMSMNTDKMKPFSLCRGIISVYTGEKDLNKCGKLLSDHLKNGGSLDDILKPFMEAMVEAGFGKQADEEIKPSPQDHKPPKKGKAQTD